MLTQPCPPPAGVVDMCLSPEVPLELKISYHSTAGVVDICLIPEVPFELPKLLEHVDKILAAKGHCVVCVAEGAGQNLAQVGSHCVTPAGPFRVGRKPLRAHVGSWHCGADRSLGPSLPYIAMEVIPPPGPEPSHPAQSSCRDIICMQQIRSCLQ